MISKQTQRMALFPLMAELELQIEKWLFEDSLPPTPEVLSPLIGCDEPLPDKYCEYLDLVISSTFGDAVEEFAPGNMYVLDLHGYPVWQAVDIAEERIGSACVSGFQFIKIIHGAPDIQHRITAQSLGRGGIKWELRGCLSRGDWSRFVYPGNSRKHRIGDGAMILALRNGANANFGIDQESKGVER